MGAGYGSETGFDENLMKIFRLSNYGNPTQSLFLILFGAPLACPGHRHPGRLPLPSPSLQETEEYFKCQTAYRFIRNSSSVDEELDHHLVSNDGYRSAQTDDAHAPSTKRHPAALAVVTCHHLSFDMN